MVKYDHISRPFAVVTIYADGSGISVHEFQTRDRAEAWIADEAQRRFSRTPHENHIVDLPALLEWVRK